MATQPAPELSLSPSEISFASFRKRVGNDKKLSDLIKACVADDAANGDLLAALNKAVGAINAP